MLELTIRLVVSLAIVVGLLLLLARFGARRFQGRSGAFVQVLHRQPLSRTAGVAVVTVGARVLVLGTTEHQVSVLTELDPEELEIELVEEPAVVDAGAGRHPIDAAELTNSIEPRDPLAGSVLSPQTWRQALQAATRVASRTTGRAS
jgi:flagellar protein FliO/FliZ